MQEFAHIEDSSPQLKKTVVMVGMMGAGKTAIGKSLATHLGVSFVDSDAEIERAANLTIAEIFSRDGEAHFRGKESRVLGRLLQAPPHVLATGGGAFLSLRNREMISRQGIAVWLSAGVDTLWERVCDNHTRPLLCTGDPYATLVGMCTARDPVYALADIKVATDRRASIEATTGRVLAALRSRPDILVDA